MLFHKMVRCLEILDVRRQSAVSKTCYFLLTNDDYGTIKILYMFVGHISKFNVLMVAHFSLHRHRLIIFVLVMTPMNYFAAGVAVELQPTLMHLYSYVSLVVVPLRPLYPAAVVYIVLGGMLLSYCYCCYSGHYLGFDD